MRLLLSLLVSPKVIILCGFLCVAVKLVPNIIVWSYIKQKARELGIVTSNLLKDPQIKSQINSNRENKEYHYEDEFQFIMDLFKFHILFLMAILKLKIYKFLYLLTFLQIIIYYVYCAKLKIYS
jgi:hypothetical protein